MERYLNLNGNSNVEAYSIHSTYIDVKFYGSYRIYRYSYESAGEDLVEEAKALAERGYGLNSFIMNCMKYLYE